MVPDVRGLFYSVCLETVGKLGLRVTAIRLTEHPMPVDGLVVDQPPAHRRRCAGPVRSPFTCGIRQRSSRYPLLHRR